MAMSEGWDAATWEGARRAQLRRALRLSVRERLEALESLAETSRRLLELGAGRRSAPPSGAASPEAQSDRCASP